MAPTIEWLRALKRADGYRDESVVTKLTQTGDRRAAPLLVARLFDAESGCLHVALEVLADWGTARAVEPASLAARPPDRFHIARRRFVQLVQNVGDPKNGRFLLDILRAYPPAAREESARNEMLASLVVALGELGITAAADTLVRHAQSATDARGADAPLGFSEAVLYALATRLWPATRRFRVRMPGIRARRAKLPRPYEL